MSVQCWSKVMSAGEIASKRANCGELLQLKGTYSQFCDDFRASDREMEYQKTHM